MPDAPATAPKAAPACTSTGTDPLPRTQGTALLDGTVPGTGSGATLDCPALTAFIGAHRQERPGLT
ncbi:hypothetical protein ACFWC9_27690 [Streptomyces goshikiensis]|uniref:hypothetical protein n=1 Tax=Streptomyces goshikiensis TaxID=1942 RepID=UPI0036996C9D